MTPVRVRSPTLRNRLDHLHDYDLPLPCRWDAIPVPLLKSAVRDMPGRSDRRYRDRVDQASPRTLLEQLVRASRRTIEENCAAFEHTADAHGENATLSPRQLWRWMAGEVAGARPVAQRVAEFHWGYAFDILIGPPLPDAPLALAVRTPGAIAPDRPVTTGAVDQGLVGLSFVERVELLRQGVHDALATGAMSEAGLDEWEETVLRHGQATRYRPAGALLVELAADFAELQRAFAQHQTSSSLRRLTRVTAQMAGLMFLVLIELNAPVAARNWARTARVAADEAGDSAMRSWVRAQEAYVHYYAGDLREALDVARHAQVIAGTTVCVGVPLAAALEARALAKLGLASSVRPVLDRAEAAVSTLDADAARPSAFGYNEAQLRFHEGNAFTHLGETGRARVAQDRALELYPRSDYLDRALVQLDRASCLALDGDTTATMAHATDTVLGLTADQRCGLILLRGQQILDTLTPSQQALPAAREFRDLLALSAEPYGAQPC
jgi:hypothetical protein